MPTSNWHRITAVCHRKMWLSVLREARNPPLGTSIVRQQCSKVSNSLSANGASARTKMTGKELIRRW